MDRSQSTRNFSIGPWWQQAALWAAIAAGGGLTVGVTIGRGLEHSSGEATQAGSAADQSTARWASPRMIPLPPDESGVGGVAPATQLPPELAHPVVLPTAADLSMSAPVAEETGQS